MTRVLESKDLQKMVMKNSHEFPELNAALIASAAIWGLKSSEMSLIEIGDILTAKNKLKRKWILRKEVSHNGFAREIYTEHESLVKYLNNYLNWRVIQQHHVTNIGEFKSLDPVSKLFLTGRGKPFSFSRRDSSDVLNMQPTGLNSYFKKLIVNSGIDGFTYKDFRNSLAIVMFREGCRITGVKKDIMTYLGIRSYDSLMRTLSADPKTIHEMLKGIHKRI